MKKYTTIALIVLVMLVGCNWLKGKKGDTGSSGQDAVISSNSYQFSCDGLANPYQKDISEISLSDVESGKQTVDVYMLWFEEEWLELPHTLYDEISLWEHVFTIGDGFVYICTYEEGLEYSGDVLDGTECLVIVKTFNK